MIDLIPQAPAPWAAKILALKNAIPFQAFSIVMVNGNTYPVARPEYVEVTASGESARLDGPEDFWAVLSMDWVVEIEVGGEVGPAPRPPRYAAKLRALHESGPHGPLVLTLQDGQRFPLAGPHQYLLSLDGRSVAVCEQEGGLVLLATSEITDLAPGT